MSGYKKIVLSALSALIIFAAGVISGTSYHSVIEENKGTYFFMQADNLMQEGKYDEALVQAYSAVSRYANNSFLLELIGDIFYCKNQQDAALANYELAKANSATIEENVAKNKRRILSKKIEALLSSEGDRSILEHTVQCSS